MNFSVCVSNTSKAKMELWLNGDKERNIPPKFIFYGLGIRGNNNFELLFLIIKENGKLESIIKTIPKVSNIDCWIDGIYIRSDGKLSLINDQKNPGLEFLMPINKDPNDNSYIHLNWNGKYYDIMSAQTCVEHALKMIAALKKCV